MSIPTRRHALQMMGLAGAAGLLHAAPRPKRILILGGTNFLGPATVEAARARGHQITLFNRGRTRPGLFPDLEKLRGDRDPNKGEGLKALEGKKWDAVLDDSGYYPRMVTASAKLLAPNVKQYIYISSGSVYADNSRENEDETGKLATIPDPTVETMGKEFENFGALKALCEKAATEAMPGHVTVVRPGYIVGPDDPTGRFTYWPVRVDRGGEVLAPGAPKDPIQFIDVRDLGEWLIKLIEDNTTGIFDAVGPGKKLGMGALLEVCQVASSAKSTLTWVSPDFLEQQKVSFPIWAPYKGNSKGFHTRKGERARKAGLRHRRPEVTVKDTLAWYKGQPADGRTKLDGPTPEREAAALAAWRNRS